MKLTSLLSATALASSFAFAPLASAQTPAPAAQQDGQSTAALPDQPAADQPADAVPTGGNDVVVTGSRIRRPNLASAVPITSITGDNLIQTGDTNLGDTLNELPQLRSTFAQQNPGLGIGVAGLNLLDLRGLGSVRTLVLVNGRRHVAADILNNAVSPDINTIPNDLIERVDIVTGGQSATYGSDAIAGVVNFVLKRNFEGVQIRGNTSVTEDGYAGEQYVSAMFGKDLGEGRGNVTLHGEYSNQDRVFGSSVERYRSVNGLITVDTDPSGADSTPDRTFFRDVRSATIGTTGVVPFTQITGGSNPCGVSTSAAPAVPFNCNYIFNADGRLVPQTGGRVGTTINGSFIGGNGESGREGTQLSIIPELRRMNFNALAHYEFSPAAELFVEAKWARVNARGSNASPTFTQGATFTEANVGATSVLGATAQRERFRIDNPFLNAADRSLIQQQLLASNCDNTITGAACSSDPTSGTRLSPAEQAQITAGTYRFVMGKRFFDIGIRDEKFQRDTFRAVVGLRGGFNEDWNYEVSANYGKFKEDTTQFGYVDRQRFLLSLDAGIDPANPGAGIQCRAKFDAAARYPFQSTLLNSGQNATVAARLASDIAACVPYNAFGPGGANNAAAANFFSYNARNHAELEQFVASGFVSGDLSQLFELPGGPIRFAVGGEYRREEALYINDALTLQGVTNAVVIGVFDPKNPFEVKEAFGEVQIPLLKDTPFFEELTVSGAGRVSDYTGAVGTVYTYNAGFQWAPIRDVRFRGNYGRSVRAPNLSETGFPVIPNFAPGFQDPCSGARIGAGSATRAANCASDLGALLPNLATLGAPSLAVLSGSNPNLLEETSDSYTIGAVIQPRFIPGLSLSVDYFDITVNNVIVSLPAQTIVDNCYDAPTLTNPFCGLFSRYRGAAGGGPTGEIPGQVQGNTLIQAGVNFAKRVRRGIDVNAAYRVDLGANARLSTNMVYVHNLANSNYQDPARPDYENRVLGELGDPVDEFRWDTDLSLGAVTLGYQMRFIGKQYVNTYEDFNELQGRAAENADYADIRQYPEVFYHNVRLTWDMPGADGADSKFRFYAGIDNLADTYPPLGLTGTGTGGAGGDRGTGNAAIYEPLGRTFYAGLRARF
jgi:outer membrane receptor protein involved in Fe transport